MTPVASTPVSVITGFLGSGKTTLLNHVLADSRMAGAAVIINEFGEIGLDHLLVTTPAENMVLLRSGCLCCTIRGDLVETLADLYRKRANSEIPPFDRVLVETTGLADPVPILRTVVTDEELSSLFRLDSVITLVDCVHANTQLDANPESVKQAALADVLVLSKTDIARQQDVRALGSRLMRINPGALQLAAVRGAIDCTALFGHTPHHSGAAAGLTESWLAEAAFRDAEHQHDGHHEHHAPDVNRHDVHIRAFCLRYEPPVSGTGLLAWLNLLAGLRGANLLRVKALVNVDGRPVVVHAVQSVIHEPIVLDAWPSEDHSTRVVFIVRDMDRSEAERTLKLFELDSVKRTPGAMIDPQEYARFVQAAAGLRP
jgi:G3E family GTPase